MAIERLGVRHARQGQLSEVQRMEKKAARAAGVDDETRAKGAGARGVRWLRRRLFSTPFEQHVRTAIGEALEMKLIVVVGARFDGGLHEEAVKIGAKPVGVGDLVVRAGGDEQLPVAFRVGGRAGMVQGVLIESESALEAAGNLRMRALPGSPFGHRADVRQAITGGELFEQQVRKRSRRLSDHGAGVASALEEHNGKAEAAADHGGERSGEPGADDGEVVEFGGFVHALPPQEAQATGGAAAWSLFMLRRRVMRASRHLGQSMGRGRSHRSEKTRPRRRFRPYETAASSGARAGAVKSPEAARASMAPLLPRVGISVAAVAPQSNAKSRERSAQSSDSPGSMKGGCTRMKTRRSMLWARRKSAADWKRPRVRRLFSFSRTPGCAVSRPMATSSCAPFSRSRKRRTLSPMSAGWHSTMIRSKERMRPAMAG